MALGGRGHQPPARARSLSPASANGTSWAGNSGSAAWSADRGSPPPVTGFRVDGRRFRRRIRSSGTASPVSVGVPTSCVARTPVPRPFDRRPGSGARLELGLPTALPWSCMPQARTTRHVSFRARCPRPQGNTCWFAQMSLLTCLAQLVRPVHWVSAGADVDLHRSGRVVAVWSQCGRTIPHRTPVMGRARQLRSPAAESVFPRVSGVRCCGSGGRRDASPSVNR